MGLFSGVSRLWRRPERVPQEPPVIRFQKQQFGPHSEPVSEHTWRVTEGRFQGKEFTFRYELHDRETIIRILHAGQPAGYCQVEYDTANARVWVWNIVMEEAWRGKGIAALLMSIGLRRMLAQHGTSSFGMRMLRLINPNRGPERFQNIGIGLMARRLGFEPEVDVVETLRMDNIEAVNLIRPCNGLPAGYIFLLTSSPGTLAVFVIDPDTGKPYPGGHRIYNSVISAPLIQRWCEDRMLIVGDANYVLRREGVPTFINHLADCEAEARAYAQRIRPVP